MYDDLIVVLACEVGERVMAIQGLLDTAVRTRGPAAAVADTLSGALDGIKAALAADVFPALRAGDTRQDEAARLVARLHLLSAATRAVHRRLGHLSLRWTQGGPDIMTRKLRDDGVVVTTPVICPSDEYDCVEDDLTSTLTREFEAGSVLAPSLARRRAITLLARADGANPLTWARLLGPLARHIVEEQGLLKRLRPAAGSGDVGRQVTCMVQARMGGPAVYAAQVAHILFMGSAADDALAALAPFVRREAAALRLEAGQSSFFGDDLVSFYHRLLEARAALLGHPSPATMTPIELGDIVDRAAPPAPLPSGQETAVLFAKLDDGVPINAVGPAVAADFAARLDACTDAAGFYSVLEQVAERPASVATILSIGWLHKAQRDYAYFRELVQAAPAGKDAAIGVLTTYGARVTARGLLLQQSLEAAHVHQIFARWGGTGR